MDSASHTVSRIVLLLVVLAGLVRPVAASVEDDARPVGSADSAAACSRLEQSPARRPAGTAGPTLPPNPNGPTLVGMAFFITELRGIDAVRDDYAFRGYVRSTWCDPSQAFDAEAEGADERVRFGAAAEEKLRDIWNPTGFPVNRTEHMDVSDRTLIVHHDGTVVSNINISLRVAADYDLRRFPFDRQRLHFIVESFLWPEDVLLIVSDSESTDFAQDFSIPDWHIEGVDTRVESSRALRGSKPFSRIVLEIDVVRESGFYLWKVLLPLVIIVALSWSIFWMSDERVATRSRITATGVLTIVAYQFVVAEDLPRIAYLTLLDKVMIASFVLLAVTVVQSLIVARYQDTDMPRAIRIDRASRIFFPAAYVSLLALITATAGR